MDHRWGIEWADEHVWLIAERVWEAPRLDRGSARPEGRRIEIVRISDWYPASDDTSWRRLGLGAWRQTHPPQDLSDDSAYSAKGIAAPCWFLVAIALLAPVAALAVRLVARFTRRRGQRRQSTGLCRHCGYDLRATPDRCPECGTPGNLAEPIGKGAA